MLIRRRLTDGFLFAFSDYDTIELRTLAQVCLVLLGESAMADAIRRGEDLHSAFGADLMGISYVEFVTRLNAGDKTAEEWRQFAKIANFGFPGGMVGATLAEYAKGYGLKITTEFGERLHAEWKRKWPEMVKYFRYIGGVTGRGTEGIIKQLYSGRYRGGVGYTQAANSFFQGLAADGAKDALWHVTKACYLDRTSPLYGSRPVIFLHDEIIPEVPNDWARPEIASNAAKELQRIMIARMQVWLPDIPVGASATLCRRWYKGAKKVVDAKGNLLPAKPWKDAAGNTKWIADLPEGVSVAA
jgi:DNA polymerase I-like protein with 3'-5' exonuclease and polymerase domains